MTCWVSVYDHVRFPLFFLQMVLGGVVAFSCLWVAKCASDRRGQVRIDEFFLRCDRFAYPCDESQNLTDLAGQQR